MVDPATLPFVRTRECGGETCVVSGESCKEPAEPVDEWCESAVDVGELVENVGVPRDIGVIVDGESIAIYGPELPVGAGSHQESVQRKELPVDVTDVLGSADVGEFGRELTLVLRASSFGQRPSFGASERGVLNPAMGFGVVQRLFRLGRVEPEPMGEHCGVGESYDADGVQNQEFG